MNEAMLEGLKYRELQKVAKDLSLKANGKQKDLVKAIMEATGSSKTEAKEMVENGISFNPNRV